MIATIFLTITGSAEEQFQYFALIPGIDIIGSAGIPRDRWNECDRFALGSASWYRESMQSEARYRVVKTALFSKNAGTTIRFLQARGFQQVKSPPAIPAEHFSRVSKIFLS